MGFFFGSGNLEFIFVILVINYEKMLTLLTFNNEKVEINVYKY